MGMELIGGYKPTGVTGEVKNKLNVQKPEAEKKEITKNVDTEQAIISSGVPDEKTIDPKNVIKSFTDDTIGKLKDFLNNNPLWTTFAEGLLAGAAAGTIERKAEINKEIASYMKDLKTNMKRTEKKEKMLNAKNTFRQIMAGLCNVPGVTCGIGGAGVFVFGNIASLFVLACTGDPTPLLGVNAVAAGCAAGFTLSATANERLSKAVKVPSIRTKGERYLPIGGNRFLTAPPDSNLLLMCKIEKNNKTGELYPTLLDQVELPEQSVSLDKSNEHWHDNWLKQSIKFLGGAKNYKEKDYDAKVNFSNPNLTSEINLYSSLDGMSITNVDKKEEQRKVQQSWENLKEKIENKG